MGLPFQKAVFVLFALSTTAAFAQTELRLGYQRGDFAAVMIEQQLLEQALGDDVAVSWVLFTSGPPMLEALSAGSIDMARTGDTPPIFAQAGEVPFVYAAGQRAVSREAMIVPADSDIQSVADLAGRQVAYASGSSANYFTYQALETKGLALDDIESVPLQPADARAAFQGGSLDAWAIWDPFLTSATQELSARSLISRYDVGDYRWFYLASETFVTEQEAALTTILEQLQVATDWIRENPEGYAELLAEQTGIPTETWAEILTQREFQDPEPFTPELIASQQELADTFFEIGSLPTEIDVAEIVWQWQPEGAAR